MKVLLQLSLVFFLVIATVFSAVSHPYHTTIAEVHYNAKTQSLEIALKVFADDLEKTLSNTEKKSVSISQKNTAKAQIATYLKKCLALEMPGKQALPQKFLGYEAENDNYWLYIEISLKPEQLKQALLRNQVFLDTFDDQMNIMNLEINGKKRTLLFKQDDFIKPLL